MKVAKRGVTRRLRRLWSKNPLEIIMGLVFRSQ